MKIHFIDKTRCNSINFFSRAYLFRRTNQCHLPLFTIILFILLSMFTFAWVYVRFFLSLFSDVMQNHIIISVAKGDKCNLVSSIYFDLFSAMCMREKKNEYYILSGNEDTVTYREWKAVPDAWNHINDQMKRYMFLGWMVFLSS